MNSELALLELALLVYPTLALKLIDKLKGSILNEKDIYSLKETQYKIFSGPNLK